MAIADAEPTACSCGERRGCRGLAGSGYRCRGHGSTGRPPPTSRHPLSRAGKPSHWCRRQVYSCTSAAARIRRGEWRIRPPHLVPTASRLAVLPSLAEVRPRRRPPRSGPAVAQLGQGGDATRPPELEEAAPTDWSCRCTSLPELLSKSRRARGRIYRGPPPYAPRRRGPLPGRPPHLGPTGTPAPGRLDTRVSPPDLATGGL
uniref:Uncharacterized protein n=1 Tax=Arundo donax TaxID=35708 RepID=A0A0A8Y4H1_ARUDO